MRVAIPEADKILETRFQVLDHGFVALVDYMGGDAAIENFARVSYGEGTRKLSKREGLIRYLVRKKHTSPLECTDLSFHIALPIHVCRQVARHRTASTNEYSARYSVVPEVTYEDYQFHIQAADNKQGRNLSEKEFQKGSEYRESVNQSHLKAFELYNDMLKTGVAREIARMHLPLNSYTYMFWKMDLNNLFHFLSLRLDLHAQYEVRQYAHAIACLVKTVAPIAFKAFEDYHLNSTTFTALDQRLLVAMAKEGYNWMAADTFSEEVRVIIREMGLDMSMSKREMLEFWDKISFEHLERDFSLESLKVLP